MAEAGKGQGNVKQSLDEVMELKKALRMALDVQGVVGADLESEKDIHEATKRLTKALAKAVCKLADEADPK